MSRIALDIDDDVLALAKQLAKARHCTVGQVISDLARQALTRSPIRGEEPRYRNGFRILPATGQIITSEMVEKWLEDNV
jgi:hypothetical protein